MFRRNSKFSLRLLSPNCPCVSFGYLVATLFCTIFSAPNFRHLVDTTFSCSMVICRNRRKKKQFSLWHKCVRSVSRRTTNKMQLKIENVCHKLLLLLIVCFSCWWTYETYEIRYQFHWQNDGVSGRENRIWDFREEFGRSITIIESNSDAVRCRTVLNSLSSGAGIQTRHGN